MIMMIIPWDGSRRQTGGSCWTRTPDLPCSPCVRHCYRRPRARHSRPHPRHRGPQGCSIACRYNSFPRISDLNYNVSTWYLDTMVLWPAGGSRGTPAGIRGRGSGVARVSGRSQQSSWHRYKVIFWSRVSSVLYKLTFSWKYVPNFLQLLLPHTRSPWQPRWPSLAPPSRGPSQSPSPVIGQWG